MVRSWKNLPKPYRDAVLDTALRAYRRARALTGARAKNVWDRLAEAMFDPAKVQVVETAAGTVTSYVGGMPPALDKPRNITVSKSDKPMKFKHITSIKVRDD
jgi:hypothetical protein